MGVPILTDPRSTGRSLSHIFGSFVADKAADDLIETLPLPSDRDMSARTELLQQARQIQRTMIDLHAALPPILFRDANWTVMLGCVIALLEKRPLCVKQIRSLLDESGTGVLRRIVALEESGIVGRRCDHRDRRRTLVLLTVRGAMAMAAFFSMLETPIAPPPSLARR